MKNKIIYFIAMLAVALTGCDKKLHEKPADKSTDKAVVTVSFNKDHTQNAPLNDVHLYWFNETDKLYKQNYYSSMNDLARARITLPEGSYTVFAVLNVGADFTVPSSRAIDLGTFLKYVKDQEANYTNMLTGKLRNVVKNGAQVVSVDLEPKSGGIDSVSAKMLLTIPSRHLPDVATKATANHALRGTTSILKKGGKQLLAVKKAVSSGNDNDTNVVTQSPMVAEQPQTTEQPEQELQPVPATVAEEPVVVEILQKQLSRWYLGFGVGLSYGRSTFASFAMDETHPGFNLGVLGGYKINKLLSAELSLDYTHMKLGTYDCCQNLWLGKDGNRYFAPLTGLKSYKYSDLTSTTNLMGLGAHLNLDLLSIWNKDSKWSAFVSPAIYGVYSNAGVKQSGSKVRTASTLHFGAGLDLGVGYTITPKIDLRLTTGINYMTGAIDALPREEHKTSYVWNSGLKLIYKL